MHSYAFLEALAIVLGVAAVTTVLCQFLRQPIVLGYLVAGLVIGPHVPIPLVASAEVVHALSEIGVILLMFSLGLEFSLGRLLRVGPTAAVTSIIQCSLMIWLGFVVGRALGWSPTESIFAGAIIAISSTTIIAKAFADQQVGGRQREIVVGILVVEDLIAVLLMAGLTAMASGTGLSARELGETAGRLLGFLVGLVAVGVAVVPRAMRAVLRLQNRETTVIAAMAIAFGVALLAHAFGYSVALGAFLAGSLIAESGDGDRVEHQLRPVRDVFAAVFFVSVGMAVDPALVAEHWRAVALLTLAVFAGKILSVALGVFLTGNGVRLAVASGLSLAQIGEFSFIIAALGLTLGVTRDFLYAVAVAVSALTTLTTPWLIRAAPHAASVIDRHLPPPLQTVAALYGSWFERLRAAPRRETLGARTRRIVLLLALDVACLAGVVIGAAVGRAWLLAALDRHVELGATAAGVVVSAGTALAALPFAIGVLRRARRLGATLAVAAFPVAGAGRADLATPPRRALVTLLQLLCVLGAALPLVAITQPFVAGVPGGVVLVIVLVTLGVAVWRSALDLHGHVRAGALAIVELLAEQSRTARSGAASATAEPGALAQLRELLPGLGEPAVAQVSADSPAVGRSLGDLDLRGRTGATVLAIDRAGGGVAFPSATAVLEAGDVVALAGTEAAVNAARLVIAGGG